VYCIIIDSSGNIYTTGYFGGTVDFDPGAGTANLTSGGGNDGFFLKLDSSGNYVWAKSTASNGEVKPFSIYIDSLNNVHTTGYFSGTADFDPGAGTANLTSVGGWDIFTYKLIPNDAPTATSVSISGTPNIGQLQTGNYTYTDTDGDTEGTSTYRWLRDAVAMGGATSSTYTTVQDDVGTTLTFEVTPVASTGTSPGVAATSAGVAIVAIAPSLTTSPATNTERSTTTLNGEITSTGGVNPTIRGFNYGLTTSYGTDTVENGSFSTGIRSERRRVGKECK